MNAVKIIILVLVLIIIAGAAYVFGSKHRPATPQIITRNQTNKMKIESSAFENNADMPSKYSCDGQGVNPPLIFSGIPAETKSLALILDDPDAPISGGFVHWIVFNIDPRIQEIAENGAPQNATEGTNSASETKYVSPCPPSGTHRYFFKLYALDAMLPLDSSAKRSDVDRVMEGHILDKAQLIGLYSRQ